MSDKRIGRPPTEEEYKQFMDSLSPPAVVVNHVLVGANQKAPDPAAPADLGFPMFPPVAESFRTDDDCAAVRWERGRKVLTIHLNCYGSTPQIRCGLRNPPGGIVDDLTLPEAWAWYCDYNQQGLPEPRESEGFDAFEIHSCTYVDEAKTILEPSSDNIDKWLLQGHRDGIGVTTIGEFDTEEEAVEIGKLVLKHTAKEPAAVYS